MPLNLKSMIDLVHFQWKLMGFSKWPVCECWQVWRKFNASMSAQLPSR